ncbi:hypothetical protein, partial [Chromohalobacter sp. 296-RDG]|uniref:hypothetical protein n=1 Tax=Chromohalobacter sp. 296-RDG TaxID=2994062 RepID=UPI00246833E8
MNRKDEYVAGVMPMSYWWRKVAFRPFRAGSRGDDLDRIDRKRGRKTVFFSCCVLQKTGIWFLCEHWITTRLYELVAVLPWQAAEKIDRVESRLHLQTRSNSKLVKEFIAMKKTLLATAVAGALGASAG